VPPDSTLLRPGCLAPFIKEIGRGKEGARSLGRTQACELMGLVLDGVASDLEVGAFALSMRIKGETAAEMLGFLDAAQARLASIHSDAPWVVLPSYNGARKLPLLTPLLAGLLHQRGANVLVHGQPDDPVRTTSAEVFGALGWATLAHTTEIDALNAQPAWPSGIFYTRTATLSAGLDRLLNVRRVVGLRNSAHSLVKLMNPITGARCLVVGSYTHPEYRVSMGEVFAQLPYAAMLLRGTEGEPVADPRRCPQMDLYASSSVADEARSCSTVQTAQLGSLAAVPSLPNAIDAASTAAYTQAVLAGTLACPAPLALQVGHIVQALGLA
jgi:anthranilate phosphoribosyltransferase